MFTRKLDRWSVHRLAVIRVLVSVLVFLCAFLVYPTWTILLSVFALYKFKAYEVLAAGVIIDSLLATDAGFLGDFTYTILLLATAVLVRVARILIEGSKHQ